MGCISAKAGTVELPASAGEMQKVEMWTSNFDPIDDDLPGLLQRKFRLF